MNGVNLGDLAVGLIALVDNWPSLIMMGVGRLPIGFAIANECEPVQLLPIGLGLPLNEAASIGITSANYGLVSIQVTNEPAPHMLGVISVVAYSYMSRVPMMRLLTTREERLTKMDYAPRPVSKTALILVATAASVLVPRAAPLIASLMIGSLLREAGVVQRLVRAAANEIISISGLCNSRRRLAYACASNGGTVNQE